MAEAAILKREEPLTDRIRNALASREIIRLYANGFIIVLGQSDVALILQTNNLESAVLNMSYTLAKTLHQNLGVTIRDFEQKTGINVLTTNDVKQKVFEVSPKENENLQ